MCSAGLDHDGRIVPALPEAHVSPQRRKERRRLREPVTAWQSDRPPRPLPDQARSTVSTGHQGTYRRTIEGHARRHREAGPLPRSAEVSAAERNTSAMRRPGIAPGSSTQAEVFRAADGGPTVQGNCICGVGTGQQPFGPHGVLSDARTHATASIHVCYRKLRPNTCRKTESCPRRGCSPNGRRTSRNPPTTGVVLVF